MMTKKCDGGCERVSPNRDGQFIDNKWFHFSIKRPDGTANFFDVCEHCASDMTATAPEWVVAGLGIRRKWVMDRSQPVATNPVTLRDDEKAYEEVCAAKGPAYPKTFRSGWDAAIDYLNRVYKLCQ